MTAVIFLGLGAVLFLAPTWAASRFPFESSAFAVMTAGSWFLGGAFVAWQASRDRSWSLVYPGIVFIASFTVLESIVLLMHAGDALGSVLTWLYMGALVVGVVTTGASVVEWMRIRASAQPVGEPVAIWVRALTALFLAFDLRIAVPLTLGLTRGGRIWPGALSEPMGRAFGAFYLAIAMSVVPVLFAKRNGPALWLMPAAIVGSILITTPAIVYLELFDFESKPGGFVYIGTYLLVLVVAAVVLALHRRTDTSRASALRANH